ncbi:ribonuclease H-like domain-containing protein [Tanacetum coccineum]
MVIRFRVGTNRPTQRLNLHVSSVSPLPKSYRDAFNDPNWQNDMCDEYNAFIKNNTWNFVPRPTDTNIVSCMWLFRHKYLADGTLSRYKTRLVANGCTQLEGIDVDETFSSTVKPGTIRFILNLATSRHCPVHQLDAKNSFLHAYYTTKRRDDLMLLLRLCCSRDVLISAQLFSSSTTDLVAYLDADWASCPTTTRRSTSGYCVFLANSLLSWSSKRQPTLSRSGVEAEYRSVANVVAETCWLQNLLRELHILLSSATLVYCDNYADIFTKGLPSALFEEFRSSLSIRCPPAPTAREC